MCTIEKRYYLEKTSSMKKKLLIFHPTIAPYRIDFFNSLSEAFDTEVYFDFRYLVFESYEKIESQLNFVPHYLKKLIKIGNRIIYSGYWKALFKEKANVVMTAEFGVSTLIALIYRWLFARRMKIIVMCDDSFDMVENKHEFTPLHRWGRKLLAQRVDEIILLDSRVVEWYQKEYSKGVFFPIMNDDVRQRKVYESLLSQSAKLSTMYELNDKKVFLYVGRLVGLKNIDTIIKAFAQLNSDGNVLIIIGSGEKELELRQLASESRGNIKFLGRQEGAALYAWYNVADVFVLASLQEAFGAVTTEALLAGCRCLISTAAGSSCLIEKDLNGNVFSPLDLNQLAVLMREETLLVKERQQGKYDNLREYLMPISYKEAFDKLHDVIEKL